MKQTRDSSVCSQGFNWHTRDGTFGIVGATREFGAVASLQPCEVSSQLSCCHLSSIAYGFIWRLWCRLQLRAWGCSKRCGPTPFIPNAGLACIWPLARSMFMMVLCKHRCDFVCQVRAACCRNCVCMCAQQSSMCWFLRMSPNRVCTKTMCVCRPLDKVLGGWPGESQKQVSQHLTGMLLSAVVVENRPCLSHANIY